MRVRHGEARFGEVRLGRVWQGRDHFQLAGTALSLGSGLARSGEAWFGGVMLG